MASVSGIPGMLGEKRSLCFSLSTCLRAGAARNIMTSTRCAAVNGVFSGEHDVKIQQTIELYKSE